MKTNETFANPYKVGDIAYANLGWNCSIPAFYQVVKTTAKTISVVQLKNEVVTCDYWGQNGTKRPIIPEKIKTEGAFRRKVDKNGYFSIDNWSYAHPWDGTPKTFNTD